MVRRTDTATSSWKEKRPVRFGLWTESSDLAIVALLTDCTKSRLIATAALPGGRELAH